MKVGDDWPLGFGARTERLEELRHQERKGDAIVHLRVIVGVIDAAFGPKLVAKLVQSKIGRASCRERV